MFLRSVSLSFQIGAYPRNREQLATLGRLELTRPVTFIVGDNGTGKSTFLEALARKMRLPAIGANDVAQDKTLAGIEPLCEEMKLVFSRKPPRGFFLRAEDFFGFTRRISALQDEMRQEIARVDEEYKDRSLFTRNQARMAFAGSLQDMVSRYGVDPDARSHGENFLSLFRTRIVPGGFYILDEPETPLSPMRQLTLLSMLMQREGDSQFLIATHSPILMAYPDAEILCFDQAPVRSVPWDELPHVSLTRDFLKAPERYLKHLRDE